MKKIILLASALALFNCSNTSNKMIVKGHVDGLKKGTLYLKKEKDNAIVIIDSSKVDDNSNFKFELVKSDTEVYLITLNDKVLGDNYISFFSGYGTTDITTSLDNFYRGAKIAGTKEQSVLNQFSELTTKIKNRNLELVKEQHEAIIAKDSSKLLKVRNSIKNYNKRQYLYTVNFALNNKNSIAAPYIALTELPNINVKYLDSINNSLTTDVKQSKYGKGLQAYIKRLKASEGN